METITSFLFLNQISVLTVPMRNGNYDNVPHHVSAILFLPYLWGMETSIKRSQKPCSCSFLPYLWGMETQVRTDSCFNFSKVLTVPMRNGNLSTVDFILCSDEFLPYLWGMETPVGPKYLAQSTQFLPYLWGMETYRAWSRPHNIVRFLPYLWGMETRYSLPLKRLGEAFLPYLWGMETCICGCECSTGCNSSYRTYEEWKLE